MKTALPDGLPLKLKNAKTSRPVAHSRFHVLSWLALGSLLSAAWSVAASPGTTAAPVQSLSKLPIREVTVFKDGHAFIAHEGEMPTDPDGNVVMDYLPTPVLGTFWPYSGNPEGKLASVVASQKRVLVSRTALSLRELLEANVGADAIFSEGGTNRYAATVLNVPVRSAEELISTSPPNSPERLPEKGSLMLLKTMDGIKAVPLERIQEVTFKEEHRAEVSSEELRNLLLLTMDWNQRSPPKTTKVGLFYVQKGVRWIPSYKVQIDGKGKALVKLQGTLLNELADLEDVSMNLVIGVPSFAFKDTIDPMALQQNLAQLSQYFAADGFAGRNSPIAAQFSNAIMTQTQHVAPYTPSAGISLGPDIGDGDKSEDLFILPVQHVTLKRGERMVLTIAEYSVPYRDVFTLNLPFAPPPEVRGGLNTEQQRELARLFNAPKVIHQIRLTNHSKYPLTTAPTLILQDSSVLAQALMTYTAPGASVDLRITTAIDFQVSKSELETKRSQNAFKEGPETYSRIDLSGKISITSHHSQTNELEVTRYVLGEVDTANLNAKADKLNVFESDDFLGTSGYPYWWNWFGWPYWWSHINGVARITWKMSIEPKQTAELAYDWHYFWR